MLRISLVREGTHAVVLRLEGRLVGPWVSVLREACEKALAEKRTPALDLSEVIFASRTGLALLLDLSTQGVVMSRCSPFLSEELKAAGLCNGTSQDRTGGDGDLQEPRAG
jgi:ABC-type transporter Mla MlaB component